MIGFEIDEAGHLLGERGGAGALPGEAEDGTGAGERVNARVVPKVLVLGGDGGAPDRFRRRAAKFAEAVALIH